MCVFLTQRWCVYTTGGACTPLYQWWFVQFCQKVVDLYTQMWWIYTKWWICTPKCGIFGLKSRNKSKILVQKAMFSACFRRASKQKPCKKRHGTAAPRREKRVKTGCFCNTFEKNKQEKNKVGLDPNVLKTCERMVLRMF